MPRARVTRPNAADIRDWHELTMRVLNDLGVKTGQDFEIVTVSDPQVRRGVGLDPRTGQLAKDFEMQTEETPPVAPQAAPQKADQEYPKARTQKRKVLLTIARAGARGLSVDAVAKETNIERRTVGTCIESLRDGGWLMATDDAFTLTDSAWDQVELRENIRPPAKVQARLAGGEESLF